MKTTRNDHECLWLTGDDWYLVVRRYGTGCSIVTHDGPPVIPMDAMHRLAAWIGKYAVAAPEAPPVDEAPLFAEADHA